MNVSFPYPLFLFFYFSSSSSSSFFYFFPILASFFLIWKFGGVMEKIVTFAIIDPISFSFLSYCVITTLRILGFAY